MPDIMTPEDVAAIRHDAVELRDAQLVAFCDSHEALRAGLEFYANEENWEFDEARDCHCGGSRRDCRCSAIANDDGARASALLGKEAPDG
jgi:hypothetical protein